MTRNSTAKKRTTSQQRLPHRLEQSRPRWKHAFVGTLVGLLLAGGAIASSTRSDPASSTHPDPETALMSVSGTIMRIEPWALRMSVYDDRGGKRHFAVANVDAMARLRTGDHVCVEVDQSGIVLNIQQTTPAIQRPTLSYASG